MRALRRHTRGHPPRFLRAPSFLFSFLNERSFPQICLLVIVSNCFLTLNYFVGAGGLLWCTEPSGPTNKTLLTSGAEPCPPPSAGTKTYGSYLLAPGNSVPIFANGDIYFCLRVFLSCLNFICFFSFSNNYAFEVA